MSFFIKKITPYFFKIKLWLLVLLVLNEMSNFKLKMKSTLWLLVGYSLELVIIKYLQALILNKSSALHERMLISHVHSFEIMEWHNLGITTLETVRYAQNVFLKSSENQIVTNFFDLTSLHFVTISCINYWDQINSWKNLWNCEMAHLQK